MSGETRLFKYALAVIRDNRLLLCRPHAFDDLIMPGGVRENDEDHITGLRREIGEELGPEVKLDEKSLQWLGHFEDVAAGRKETIIEMDVYLGRISGRLKASQEIAELVWHGHDSDPKQLSAIVRNHIWPALILRGLV